LRATALMHLGWQMLEQTDHSVRRAMKK
jgi:hypothetical protein